MRKKKVNRAAYQGNYESKLNNYSVHEPRHVDFDEKRKAEKLKFSYKGPDN